MGKLDYNRNTNRVIGKKYTITSGNLLTLESKLNFGKHSGKIVKDVLIKHKDYFIYLRDNTTIPMDTMLLIELRK